MSTILTITLNPAVDLATSVAQVVAGPKLYCKPARVDPGGGGVNVARAICKLEGRATALVALGGATGARLQRLLIKEGVPLHPVHVSGETRESFAVTDEGTGAQFRFSLPGQTLTPNDGDRLIAEIASAGTPGGYVVLSGGVAPGLGNAYPERVFAAVAPHTDKVIIDTSKAALARLIAHPATPAYVLRLDHREAEQAAGHPLNTAVKAVAFARQMINRGVARTIVTGREDEGSILVTSGASYICRAPKVAVVSKIGAGDALVGAFTLSLSRGDALEMALRWGVAAAAATMGTEGTGLCETKGAKALFQRCIVEPI